MNTFRRPAAWSRKQLPGNIRELPRSTFRCPVARNTKRPPETIQKLWEDLLMASGREPKTIPREHSRALREHLSGAAGQERTKNSSQRVFWRFLGELSSSQRKNDSQRAFWRPPGNAVASWRLGTENGSQRALPTSLHSSAASGQEPKIAPGEHVRVLWVQFSLASSRTPATCGRRSLQHIHAELLSCRATEWLSC